MSGMITAMEYPQVNSGRPSGGRSDESDEKVTSGLSSAQAAERAAAVAAVIKAAKDRTPPPAPARRTGRLARLFGAGMRIRKEAIEQA